MKDWLAVSGINKNPCEVRTMTLRASFLPIACLIGVATLLGIRPTHAAEPQKPAVAELPLGEVKPLGWLKNQLQIQTEGLSGHLDEFWPDIRDSSWIGGKAEGWERTPYWMDGIVPLAYLLDDPKLKAKAQKYIDYILDHQQVDGWLGPIGDQEGHKPYDVWPLFVLFKALTQYQEATGDPRIIPALLKCSHKINVEVSKTPLYEWAHFRGADLVVSLHWLYERTGDQSLPTLTDKILKQSYDWRHHFENFTKFQNKSAGYFGLDNHGVNNAMGLKFGVERWLTSGDAADKASIFAMLDTLDRYHGQATGMFSCDEHYGGTSPSQGTELCTVAEMMYSLELAEGITGDAKLGDRLEKLAFNAFPATFKKDMTAHQYDQQCNQVVCKLSDPRVYTDNGPESNLYGLEPNFGCCTANMHQGWPKFVSHLWGRNVEDGGLVALAYAPSVVETKVGGVPVRVELKTDYPFDDQLTFVVKAEQVIKLPLHIRIPGWAGEVLADVKGGMAVDQSGSRMLGFKLPTSDFDHGILNLTVTGQGEETIHVTFPMPVKIREGYNHAISVERGPLVYALKIDTEWFKLRGKEPFADYEVFPTTPWNYALVLDRDHPEKSITFETKPVGPMPFSPEGAPVVARARGIRLPGWTLEKNAAAPPPTVDLNKLTNPAIEAITLIPYGCTDLRVTEFPIVPSR